MMIAIHGLTSMSISAHIQPSLCCLEASDEKVLGGCIHTCRKLGMCKTVGEGEKWKSMHGMMHGLVS